MLAEAAPPCAAAKTAIIVYGKRIGTTLTYAPIWEAKFANFSQRAAVIITEGISGAYFCDADTPESTAQFLQYLQKYGIGLEVVFGTGLQEAFDSARLTCLSCHNDS